MHLLLFTVSLPTCDTPSLPFHVFLDLALHPTFLLTVLSKFFSPFFLMASDPS